ncbi:MAG TPA: MBL fold metallo-hydrolase [Opitutaceae bacterium]|jgi:L-ascorbate metabolism protein UlaG (beta-lactamase superfamily)
MTPAPSDHFNGKTFLNPGADAGRGGVLDLIRWKAAGRAAPWPAEVPVEQRRPPAPPGGPGLVATWVGQSTFLLQAAGLAVLTDPVFSGKAGPLGRLGPARAARPGVAFGALPRVDAVLLSHDHCDLPTLRRLSERDNPLVVAPVGHAGLLASAGVRRVQELDWWEAAAFKGAEATLVPARHWCRRRPFATNVRLWGGFILRMGGRMAYFAGDTGYDDRLFLEVSRRFGPVDLALLPIGAYEPRWFMRDAHMNPPEAVRAHRELGARRSLAMHWGTFPLTDEPWDEPPRALRGAGGGPVFLSIRPGESIAA